MRKRLHTFVQSLRKVGRIMRLMVSQNYRLSDAALPPTITTLEMEFQAMFGGPNFLNA